MISPVNVRTHVGDVSELVDSIREHGILEPLLVREMEDGRFEVIIGSRRLSAARELALAMVPAVVQDISDTDAILRSIIENVQRGDLSLEDRVMAYKRLQKIAPKELGSMRGLARATGIRHQKISQDFQAFEALLALRPSGVEVASHLPPSSSERRSGQSIPEYHATLLEQAMSATRSSIQEEQRSAKYEELARAIAPLEQERAKRLLDYFKMYPERPVADLQSMVFARVERQVILPANTARRLEEMASERGNRSVDEVIAELVESSPDPVEEYDQYPSDFEVRSNGLDDERSIHSPESTSERFTGEGGGFQSSLLERERRPLVPASPAALSEDPTAVQVNNRVLWNLEHTQIEADFFTVGYSGRTIDEFLSILSAAGAGTLVDIRANPVSQYKPDFSKDNLCSAVEAAGMKYVHVPELGVPTAVRRDAAKNGARAPIWEWYDANVVAKIAESDFSEFIQDYLTPELQSKPAFMCVEIDPTACHRHRLFRALQNVDWRGYDI